MWRNKQRNTVPRPTRMRQKPDLDDMSGLSDPIVVFDQLKLIYLPELEIINVIKLAQKTIL